MLNRTALISAASLLLLSLVHATPAASEPFKLRISGENPDTGIDLIMARRFAENLEAALGDDFSHDFFHTGALGDEQVHMQMIRTGQIDVYPMGSDAVQLDPNWAVFDLPFLFENRDQVAAALDGEIGEMLRRSMREKSGLQLLAFGEIGFRQITNSTRPIQVPSDLQGVKIRVPGNKARVFMFETYGAVPVSMNLGELFLALSNGTVDGQENPVRVAVTFSFDEVQKFLSMTNHVYTPVSLVMNGAKFDALSAEQHQAVMAAAKEAAEYTRTSGEQTDAQALKDLRDAGVVQVNDADTNAFREASEPVWESIRKTVDSDLMEKLAAAVR
jgi:TRAP-type transport system periplasmic protein